MKLKFYLIRLDSTKIMSNYNCTAPEWVSGYAWSNVAKRDSFSILFLFLKLMGRGCWVPPDPGKKHVTGTPTLTHGALALYQHSYGVY